MSRDDRRRLDGNVVCGVASIGVPAGCVLAHVGSLIRCCRCLARRRRGSCCDFVGAAGVTVFRSSTAPGPRVLSGCCVLSLGNSRSTSPF